MDILAWLPPPRSGPSLHPHNQSVHHLVGGSSSCCVGTSAGESGEIGEIGSGARFATGVPARGGGAFGSGRPRGSGGGGGLPDEARRFGASSLVTSVFSTAGVGGTELMMAKVWCASSKGEIGVRTGLAKGFSDSAEKSWMEGLGEFATDRLGLASLMSLRATPSSDERPRRTFEQRTTHQMRGGSTSTAVWRSIHVCHTASLNLRSFAQPLAQHIPGPTNSCPQKMFYYVVSLRSKKPWPDVPTSLSLAKPGLEQHYAAGCGRHIRITTFFNFLATRT
ncbi:hypothetical protein NEOLEDRAFT_208984 [Neolentinus lepideus HHB14362 ss-1]|uniref:Uncharacterized protein n=1 Tax=Neolentinus lepideus HHB14362 ss-1 TaxID=1314782 RepID=A0A165TK57_9AGAM|nr:hypothetical protein NEOLEDRAFT_208984 [Neolentinus lepideus HHB14362 ss-1]